MRTTISKFKYLFIMIVIAGLASCKGEIGPIGPDGTDGTDGNANVTTISILASDMTWTPGGDYLGREAEVFTLDTIAVNQDIIDHGAVLGYCHLLFTSYDEWLVLPFHWEGTSGNTSNVVYTFNLNEINLYAYITSSGWNPNGLIPEYRFILITDDTISKSISSEQGILNKLENAGVDVNDYYQVMDYYNLEY